MIIATVREIKDHENRVGLTPHGIPSLIQAGHRVLVERSAGIGSSYSDANYVAQGAELCDDAATAFREADIVVKVKEPISSEYPLLRDFEGKTLFTYLHLSGVDPELTQQLCQNRVTAIAYETVRDEYGHLPLLAPMSEVAGVLAVQYGAQYLQKKYHGRGLTLGNIPHTQRANVVVMGGGFVGTMAAKTAAGMGAHVQLFDINDAVIERLSQELREYLGPVLSRNVQVLKPSREALDEALRSADVLIGAVLIPGKRAPYVVSEEQVKMMLEGSVIVDVSIDQGGCIWGSRATSHSEPIYYLHGKIYCCVTNMPGQVSRQSTQALTAATLPYIEKMALLGAIEACRKHPGLAQGVNTYDGKIRSLAVAEDLGMMDMYEELKLDMVTEAVL